MKTVLLCPELFAREGGIQRITRLYLKALCEMAQKDDEVRLVALNDSQFPEASLRRYANERLTQRHACHRSKPLYLWHALQITRGANRAVCGHIGQLTAAWLAKRFNPQLDYYLVAHGIEVWRPYTWIERIALRGARRILCVSEYTRGEMERYTSFPNACFAVVPNALDPDFALSAREVASTRTEPVILTVTRLDATEAYKGVDHLIEALPAVRRNVPGIRLRVIGTGADLPRLQTLAAQLGVADVVEFVGFVSDEELRVAYRDCTLFALPSRKEGFGIVFLEAMAHGKPCLGARAGAVPEVIDDSSGVLADYGNVEQIAAQTVWALQHRWDPCQILQHAAQFNYARFKIRLVNALAD